MADIDEAATEPETVRAKTPVWFWIVGVVAVLWNGMGVLSRMMALKGGEAYLAALPEEQRVFYENLPGWYEWLWSAATLLALMASISLLMRARYATGGLFILAIVSYIISAAYLYGFTAAYDLMGGIGGVIFSLVIFLSLIAFWRVAAWGVKAGVLR